MEYLPYVLIALLLIPLIGMAISLKKEVVSPIDKANAAYILAVKMSANLESLVMQKILKKNDQGLISKQRKLDTMLTRFAFITFVIWIAGNSGFDRRVLAEMHAVQAVNNLHNGNVRLIQSIQSNIENVFSTFDAVSASDQRGDYPLLPLEFIEYVFGEPLMLGADMDYLISTQMNVIKETFRTL